MKSSTYFTVLCISLLLFMLCFSCFEVNQNQTVEIKGQIAFKIILTSFMMRTYDITYVRLTIKQDSTTIWGPEDYNATAGSASMEGILAGTGYVMYADALDSNYSVVCSG